MARYTKKNRVYFINCCEMLKIYLGKCCIISHMKLVIGEADHPSLICEQIYFSNVKALVTYHFWFMFYKQEK